MRRGVDDERAVNDNACPCVGLAGAESAGVAGEFGLRGGLRLVMCKWEGWAARRLCGRRRAAQLWGSAGGHKITGRSRKYPEFRR